jgi:hypothetical protein
MGSAPFWFDSTRTSGSAERPALSRARIPRASAPVGRYTRIGLGVGMALGVGAGLNRCHGDCTTSVLVSSAFLGFVGYGAGCSIDSVNDPTTRFAGCQFLNEDTAPPPLGSRSPNR